MCVYSPVHDEVGQHIIPSIHVDNRASACANTSNSCSISKCIIIATEKGVNSQTTMPLEKIQN